MALKRSYQVQSKYTRGAKRARTMDNEITKLKKQVSRNKHELKYYDGWIRDYTLEQEPFPDTQVPANNQSIFTNVFQENGQTAKNPTFIGRKIYVRKIEMRQPKTSENKDDWLLMWREKRKGKTVPPDLLPPQALDPEYHTLLRYNEPGQEISDMSNTTRTRGTVYMGKQGRLVEFDSQTTAIAGSVIVSGDIRVTTNPSTQEQVGGTQPFTKLFIRVWYTDG